jgi:hypothetical protein
MAATAPFQHRLGNSAGYLVGYTLIIVSFLLVYFGIRSYRDDVGHGQITFAKAFGVGLAITLITCVCYVLTWEIIYFNFMHGFMDSYFTHMADKARASAASPPELAAKLQEIQRSKELYENPLYNSALTFLEPFPVGLVITLISAAILRRKTQPEPAESIV